ncbi:hypothetical protein CCMA1212_003767 [Trichoderma ghanense]|uniref:Uncharacterized protein n=1 Tax=Trichoderma ghanense TaxID=65468 RepID=A0ABY2H760_9HYPO
MTPLDGRELMNPPLPLNGRTLTTTLMFPPPAGAMAARMYAGTYAGPLGGRADLRAMRPGR